MKPLVITTVLGKSQHTIHDCSVSLDTSIGCLYQLIAWFKRSAGGRRSGVVVAARHWTSDRNRQPLQELEAIKQLIEDALENPSVQTLDLNRHCHLMQPTKNHQGGVILRPGLHPVS